MMQKSVWIGIGAGLIVVAIAAAGLWVADRPAEPAPGSLPAVSARAPVPGAPMASVPVPYPSPQASQTPRSAGDMATAQNRRTKLAQVRAEFDALRAQGAQASPAKMRAVVDELESLSPPGLTPQYFQVLRSMLDTSSKVHALNQELQDLAKSTTSKDVARQQAILAEMRTLGERVQVDARTLQAQSAALSAGARKP